VKKFLTIFLTIIFIALAAPVVLAGTQTQNGCSTDWNTDTTKILAWENIIGDTSDGNDNLKICIDANIDLNDIDHTLAGNCHAPFFGSNTWNDCISSVSIWIPAAPWHACFYENTGYSLLRHSFTGPFSGQRFNISGNDKISSISMRNFAC